MKYLGLLAALTIIYLVASQMRSTGEASKSSFAEAQNEASLVDPSANRASTEPARVAATPSNAGASMRAPLDRARQLNSLVKQRNGAGEF